MEFFPVFLSVIFVIRDEEQELEALLRETSRVIAPLVSDYEIIVVDNASETDKVAYFRRITAADGIANIQIFALTKEVDQDTASWVGLENSLGDFCVVSPPNIGDVHFVPAMLAAACAGADVVFASNDQKLPQGWIYRIARKIFHRLYATLNGIDLASESSQFRMLSRTVVNFVQQHPHPTLSYHHLPATSGFSRVQLRYRSPPPPAPRHALGASFDRGLRLLVSTTRAPMRLVTSLSLFGALANLVYAIYVIIIAVTKGDVAAGWTSLSLQQSGMFFLISLVLLVLGEYILHMARLNNEGPPYHVAQEFTSAVVTRHQRLNVEVPLGRPREAPAIRDPSNEC